jgi:hypothetical protein
MKYIIFFISFGLGNILFAQKDEERDRIIEQRIEFIGENLENSDIDLTTYLEDLYYFYDNPINLNQTNYNELARLNILTDNQIYAILNYQIKYGKFLSVYELNAIPELDNESIDMILPFITVGEAEAQKVNLKKMFTYGKSDLILRYIRGIEQREGYIEKPDSILQQNPNKQYLGSPDRIYSRYRYTYKDKLSYGITGEKDAGEEFFKGTQKYGFDFYSAHFMVQDVGIIHKIVVGDFQANFGQGLTMWSGFNMGKTANVLNVKRYARGLRAYTSVNENNFLRGGGITLQKNLNDNIKIDFTAFGSQKRIDANLNVSDTLFGDEVDIGISSFQTTGYHRTVNEMEKRKTVKESIIGGASHFTTQKLKVGIVGVYTNYDKPLEAGNNVYAQFNFVGTSNYSMGVNYMYFKGKMSFFGETTTSQNLSIATLNGVTWHADPRLDLVVLHRYIDKKNQSLYTNAFGGSSTNENGLYIGAKAKITKHLNISAYYDQSTYHWLKWLTDGPSVARDILIQADYKINYNSSFYVRFKNKITERNSKETVTGIKPQVFLRKTNLRLHYAQRISSQITVKSRVEGIRFSYDDVISHGIMFYQDLSFKFNKIPLKLTGRYAIFDTDNYDTRIYAYENDLLYLFSIPSYYYKGIRAYVMAKYDITDKIDFWIRWGVYSYANEEEISSGLETIYDSKKSDIKLQLKIRF